MQTSIRHLITGSRIANSPYSVNGIEPSAIRDFDAGLTPSGFAISRAASAFGYDPTGRLLSYAADTMRYDARGPLRTALLEPAATNLMTRSVASATTGWTTNGANATNLALDALGRFAGVRVASKGAIWHRLDHLDEPAVTNSASYHLSAFVIFGSSGKILVTLRNWSAGVESRIELSTGAISVLGSGAGLLSNARLTALGVDSAYRVDLEMSPNFTGGLSIGFGPGSSTSGADMILLAAQFEPGTLGTSFIESAGSATTRPADSVNWAASAGSYDLRIVDADGIATDSLAVNVGAGWTPHSLPFSPARVVLYPPGTL